MSVRAQALLLLALAASVALVACGKKGPPLPPLVRLPAQPADVAAVRRGAAVDLTFRVPKANVDGSTPASLERIDVYAWTVPAPVDSAEVLRRGVRVGSVAVNRPPDPDKAEETPAKTATPTGVDQDAVATISETLPAGADAMSYRTYVAVGVSTRGRRGNLSARVAVPLTALPPAPTGATLTYTEKAITVSWARAVAAEGAPAFRYVVRKAGDTGPALTRGPIEEVRYSDSPVLWGEEKCFEIRTVAVVEGVRLESVPAAPLCVTPKDTFAPAAPDGLVGVGAEGSVSLIWTASTEADLAGYVVLRAEAPSTTLRPITPAPITDTNFRDTVPAGARMTYAVQAVDKSGNTSAASTPVTESAR